MAIILDFGKQHEAVEKEKAVIYNTLVKFYKDLDETGTVSIPYFLRARDKYNQIIKSVKDVHYFYKKIMAAENIS